MVWVAHHRDGPCGALQEEQRNIMDVLEQVSTLFADHPDLLKEFTYFLPDAVQVRPQQMSKSNE